MSLNISPRKEVNDIIKICPFMSTFDKKVPCTKECALCTVHGSCNINNAAIILEELKKELEDISNQVSLLKNKNNSR